MKKWFHDFSAQYVAGIAVVVTVAVLAALGALTSYWAWDTDASGPMAAAIVFFLIAGCLLFYQTTVVRRQSADKSKGLRNDLAALIDLQRNNPPHYYLHIELTDVNCSHVNDSSPHIVLQFALRNFFLVPVELVRVVNSEGTIDVHILPQLQQHIGQPVRACSETTFTTRLDLTGDVPNHLRSEANAERPRPLRWDFTGEWFASIDGEEKLVWDRSHHLTYTALLNVPVAR